MIRLLTALLLLTALVSAQELHTFKNGEVADADKLNENFETLSRASRNADTNSLPTSFFDESNQVLYGSIGGSVGLYEKSDAASDLIFDVEGGSMRFVDGVILSLSGRYLFPCQSGVCINNFSQVLRLENSTGFFYLEGSGGTFDASTGLFSISLSVTASGGSLACATGSVVNTFVGAKFVETMNNLAEGTTLWYGELEGSNFVGSVAIPSSCT